GFDLTRQTPLRVSLQRTASDEYLLGVVVHHIAADGWSLGPLTRDLAMAYVARTGGVASERAPLPVQYADFALWQHAVLGEVTDPESAAARQLGFWRERLAGAGTATLPLDRSRPAVRTGAGAETGLVVPADVHAGLLRIAKAHNASLFMVVHAGLAALLSRMTGSDDVTVGTAIAGRGERVLDDLVGMFVNTLALRTQVGGQLSFAELLTQAKEADLAAFAHADIPFERLVELLNPERSTARHPLFQVALSFENLPDASFELPGLSVSAVDFDVDTAKFDLLLTVREAAAGEEAGAYAEFSYASALFDQSTVEKFAQRFQRLLAEVVADTTTPVGDLELLDSTERDELLTR
ncbi:condensation domain-containing protein, partial [Streptomyces sp. NPDC058664]|uniref:condensation domain-containing protein n=1 Tax=Streptomyces sp. NPDC058664 TaxID=3346585 RepID=UPI00365888E2